MKPPLLFRRPRSARGAASLIVVAVLLAVMAFGVVFTNRNLIIEQKTSANQYRATVAAEAAEAGIEWAIGMMNKPERITTACATSAVATDPRFKNKYHAIDPSSGLMTPVAVAGTAVHAACVANPNATAGWSCSCPAAGTEPNPAAAAPATGYQPSFAVRFEPTLVAGTTRVTAYGCTGRITTTVCGSDATAMASVLLGGVPALGTPPGAALTVRGSVDVPNAALQVSNTDPTTNGITINAGFGINSPNAVLSTVSGTPPQTTLVGNDPSLRNTTEDQMFATYFGMSKDVFKSLPSVTKLTCPCTETTLINAYNNDNARVLFLDGALSTNSTFTLGTQDAPVLVIVEGNVTLSGVGTIYGLIYSGAIVWDNTGGGNAVLNGAAISEGSYQGNGTPNFSYDPKVLTRLRIDSASFVRVPGSWRDFNP